MRQTAAKESGLAPTRPHTLEQLYERYGAFVRVLMAQLLGPGHADIDDLAQEVFLVILERFSRTDIDAPGRLLYQIAVRVATNARRRVRIRRWLLAREGSGGAERRTPEVLAEAREETQRVYAALEKLSDKKRTVFILFELQGLSGQEIADSLGIPPRTVHTRLFYARNEFLAAYEGLSRRAS